MFADAAGYAAVHQDTKGKQVGVSRTWWLQERQINLVRGWLVRGCACSTL